MKIETKFLGTVEIEEKDIIQFENGIPGFEGINEYVILPIEQDSPFALLQAINEQEIGFVLAFPFAFKSDYAFDISDEDKNELKVSKPEDLAIYSIVTVKENFNDSTLNLLAPVLINVKEKWGKQLVLQDTQANPLQFPLHIVEGSAK
jgi:flagellar assembly factor FliW